MCQIFWTWLGFSGHSLLSSYCWIAAICRTLWNEIRKESYNNTTGWRITLPQGLAPKCHKGDVILTSVSIYPWLFHSCFVFLVVSAHWCHATWIQYHAKPLRAIFHYLKCCMFFKACIALLSYFSKSSANVLLPYSVWTCAGQFHATLRHLMLRCTNSRKRVWNGLTLGCTWS